MWNKGLELFETIVVSKPPLKRLLFIYKSANDGSVWFRMLGCINLMGESSQLVQHHFTGKIFLSVSLSNLNTVLYPKCNHDEKLNFSTKHLKTAGEHFFFLSQCAHFHRTNLDRRTLFAATWFFALSISLMVVKQCYNYLLWSLFIIHITI